MGGSDASAGAAGVSGGAGGNTGGSSGGGAGAASSGGASSGGAGGDGGQAGNSGTGGSVSSNCKGKGFTLLPDPPKAGGFKVTYSDVDIREDIRLDVACTSGAATVKFTGNDGDCGTAGPPPCNWHFQVTNCAAGLASIAFYADAIEGGTGAKIADCSVQVQP